MSEPKPQKTAQRISKVSNIHEHIIAEMLRNPTTTQETLAEQFGYSKHWMSRIINSDAFQARLAERRKELLDPDVKVAMNRQIRAALVQTTDTIRRRLEDPATSADFALQSLATLQRAHNMLNED